ncbi:DedA family protein [Acetohalobium arabaticum]|uniref:DedA family protein n=1 Tax=Acetohalobium arabaticum TaxID=28187 RepID=UPI0002D3E671|nr:VTT domain-containing protein [Acetohalobium arabaticum]
MDFNSLIALIIDLSSQYGYLIIFLSAVGEGMGLPIPDGIILAISSYFVFNGQMSVLGLVSYFVLGSIIGNLTAYSIGRWSKGWLKESSLFKLDESDRMDRIEYLFSRYGIWALLITQIFSRVLRVPMIYAAGFQEMNILKYSAVCIAGNFVWGMAWVLGGLYVSSNWTKLEELMTSYKNLQFLVVGLVVVIFYLFYRRAQVENG